MRKSYYFDQLFVGVTGIQRKSRVSITGLEGIQEADFDSNDSSSDSDKEPENN